MRQEACVVAEVRSEVHGDIAGADEPEQSFCDGKLPYSQSRDAAADHLSPVDPETVTPGNQNASLTSFMKVSEPPKHLRRTVKVGRLPEP